MESTLKTYTPNRLEHALTNKYISCILKANMRYTLAQFRKEYADDAACLRAVLDNRFGDTCPKCGVVGVKWHPITGRKAFVCSECDKHVYPLADTIFRKSETSLWNWFYAIYQFSVAKNGVSAKELERTLGVTYKTAWRMCKQIRLLMEQEGSMLGGDGETVEIDETYIGGKHERKYGNSKKQVVFGAVERYGRASITHVKSSESRVLLPEIVATIAPKTHIYSDEYGVYRTLHRRGYSHTTVNHGKLEYVRGHVSTNAAEGLWSQLKRSIDGTYHAVSPKYLQQYLNQFAFHYNYRDVATFPILLERAVKRV